MFCSNCGQKLPENSVFCPHCGSKVESLSDLTPTNPAPTLIPTLTESGLTNPAPTPTDSASTEPISVESFSAPVIAPTPTDSASTEPLPITSTKPAFDPMQDTTQLPAPTPTNPTPKKKTSKLPLIIIIAVSALLLIAAGVCFFVFDPLGLKTSLFNATDSTLEQATINYDNASAEAKASWESLRTAVEDSKEAYTGFTTKIIKDPKAFLSFETALLKALRIENQHDAIAKQEDATALEAATTTLKATTSTYTQATEELLTYRDAVTTEEATSKTDTYGIAGIYTNALGNRVQFFADGSHQHLIFEKETVASPTMVTPKSAKPKKQKDQSLLWSYGPTTGPGSFAAQFYLVGTAAPEYPGYKDDTSHIRVSIGHQWSDAYIKDPSIDAQASDKTTGRNQSADTDSKKNEKNSSKSASKAALLDITDPEVYYSVNVFLSNFSEVNSFTRVGSNNSDIFDAQSYDLQELVAFSVLHNGRNKYDTWEYVPTDQTWYPLKSGQYNVRISANTVKTSIWKYFQIACDVSKVTGEYQYEKDYIYFKTTNAAGMPEGIALVKSIEASGENQFKVQFDVYLPSKGNYDVTDQSLYKMTAKELMKNFAITKPQASGEALIEISQSADTAPYKMLRYSQA